MYIWVTRHPKTFCNTVPAHARITARSSASLRSTTPRDPCTRLCPLFMGASPQTPTKTPYVAQGLGTDGG